MSTILSQTVFETLGTVHDDQIANAIGAATSSEAVDRVNGLQGDDVIATGGGSDLAAGDMVGDEWQFIDGRWVYDAAAVVVSAWGSIHSFDDLIETGAGDDVLLGNWGNDTLRAGLGNDLLNAGWGADDLFGGLGDDTLNLEEGNDYAEGGLGADLINGGVGDDTILGDDHGLNLLDNGAAPVALEALAGQGGWSFSDDEGTDRIAQSAATVAGETYTISFELATNLAGGFSAAEVEVLWNGEVVETVRTSSAAYTTYEIDVVSSGAEGELSFRAVEPVDAVTYDHSGAIVSYDKSMTIAGAETTVAAFAPGQSALYQVIDGHLHVFDTQTGAYTAVGNAPGFKINAVGFNIEDDLIYGVAKSAGTDTLGQAVSSSDIVMIDADGATYRIGAGFYGDYVGDFDDQGNLWTFHTSLDRISVVDVDNLDANGNPQITYYHFDASMFTDRTYDLAFNAAEQAFYAVISPKANGADGKVVKIDMSEVADGGTPIVSEIAITGTLYGEDMVSSMARGAYGAVFFDGDGNLYYGLNRGDHDLVSSTANTGAIFRVNMDWDRGQAYAEFMSKAPATGSNDGAVDPRSSDAFVTVDADSAVLLREPSLTLVEGSNDTLNGGEGDDIISGNAGDDQINGGVGNDRLFGDEGNDNMHGADGNDVMAGGEGNDSLQGQSGSDVLSGEEGKDYLNGGSGSDALNGGIGTDKLVGGTGADTIEGGAGNDHLWGGNWSVDGEADTFVFANGSGKDFVHDFEAEHDVLDLSGYDTDLATVLGAAQDQGWATIIDLSKLDGGEAGDKLILKSVDLADLGEDNFIF
ncbi:calcium-binding protein [Mameliella sp.]|uniref:calcium-binding protein n=1 Tax=Mameliella sp. TaxID=1924940 RepID=UPI003B4FFB68